MKVQLTRDLALPLAKKGCTFGVELKTTGKDGETIYFVHYYTTPFWHGRRSTATRP